MTQPVAAVNNLDTPNVDLSPVTFDPLALDSVTLLTAGMRVGKGVKRQKDGTLKKTNNDHAHWWKATRHSFDTLEELLKILRKAGRSCQTIMVHGEPKPEANPERMERTLDNFDSIPRRYVVLDLDGFPAPSSSGAACAELARSLLPEEFHDAACIWHATPGHWITKGDARLRMIFMTDKPVYPEQVKLWLPPLTTLPADTSIYQAQQPIFLSVDIPDGQSDFLTSRWGLLPGKPSIEMPDLPEYAWSAREKRGLPANPDVEANAAHAIGDAIYKLAARDHHNIINVCQGRRNAFRLAAADFHDFGVTEDVTEALLDYWREPEDHTYEQMVDALDEHALDPSDIEYIADTMREIAESMVEQGAFDGEPLDRSHLEKQVEDAYKGAKNAFGCKFISLDQIAEREERLVSIYALESAQVTDDFMPAEDEPAVDPTPSAPAEPPKKKGLYAPWLSDIYATPRPAVEQLVHGLMTRGELSVSAGAPGAGKTADKLLLCVCIASGMPFHGRKVKQGAALYIGSENKEEDERRLAALIKRYNLDPNIPLRIFPRSVTLLNVVNGNAVPIATKDEKDILKLAKETTEIAGVPLKYIVLDNLRRVTAPGSTSREEDVTMVMKSLERIRDATGATVDIIHHTVRDGDRYAGSGAIESHVDSVWMYGATDPDTKSVVKKAPTRITFQKLRLGDKSQILEYRFASEVVAHDTDGEPIQTVVSVDVDATCGLGAVQDDENEVYADGTCAAPGPSPEELAEQERHAAAERAKQEKAEKDDAIAYACTRGWYKDAIISTARELVVDGGLVGKLDIEEEVATLRKKHPNLTKAQKEVKVGTFRDAWREVTNDGWRGLVLTFKAKGGAANREHFYALVNKIHGVEPRC